MNIKMFSKKFVAINLVFILAFLCSPLCFAFENGSKKIVTIENYASEMIDHNNPTMFSSTAPKQYATYGEGSEKYLYSCYSLLNDAEKTYYDEVVALPVDNWSFKIEYSPALPIAQFNKIDFNKIMNAVGYDHPEIFYYGGYSYGISGYADENKNITDVLSVTYNIASPNDENKNSVYSPQTAAELNSRMWEEFNRARADFNTSTRYDFIKSLHDYLCESVSYVINNKSCFDPYGTLVEKEAVCQGYAETFKLFCDFYSIPCVYQSGVTDTGGSHGWNAVQMEDGKWYSMDVTWDDQGPQGTFYDFFLSGLNTVPIYFKKIPFASSHIKQDYGYSPIFDFATEKYTETNHQTKFMGTYNSKADYNKNLLTLSAFDAQNFNVYYNGMKLDTNHLATGSKIAVNGENWEVIVLGDANYDGECTGEDYTIAVNLSLKSAQADKNIIAAMDIYKDNVIDVLDLAQISKYSCGTISHFVVN